MDVTRPRSIDVHIDELVLHGFEPTDAEGIGEAVRSELTRLFTERESMTPTRDSKVARFDAGSTAISRGSSAGVGADVARVVHRIVSG